MPTSSGNNIPFQFGQASTAPFTKKMKAGHENKHKGHHGGAKPTKHSAPNFPFGLANSKKQHHGHAAIQKAAGRRLFGGGSGQNQFFQQNPRNNQGRQNA